LGAVATYVGFLQHFVEVRILVDAVDDVVEDLLLVLYLRGATQEELPPQGPCFRHLNPSFTLAVEYAPKDFHDLRPYWDLAPEIRCTHPRLLSAIYATSLRPAFLGNIDRT
jgi:hypothetical protein